MLLLELGDGWTEHRTERAVVGREGLPHSERLFTNLTLRTSDCKSRLDGWSRCVAAGVDRELAACSGPWDGGMTGF